MQQNGKVAKYLSTGGRETNEQAKGKSATPAGGLVPDQPIQVDETLFQNSLTPTNVLKKIHQDIVRIFGMRPGLEGKFTPLEAKLIQALERIVRQGHCPSLIYREKDLKVALEFLDRFFERARVTFEDALGGRGRMTVPVFRSLLEYAREAADYESQIKQLRAQVGRQPDPARKQAVKDRIDQLKSKKDQCLVLYQKVIFSDAEALQSQRKQRQLSLFGKSCTLDDLIAFFRKGGSVENHDTMTNLVDDDGMADPYQQKGPNYSGDPEYIDPVKQNPLEQTFNTGTNLNFPGITEQSNDMDLSLTFEESSEDVLDWRSIKKKS